MAKDKSDKSRRPSPPPAELDAPIEIIVDPSGQVVFTDLPPELQEILRELDPDATRSEVCLVPDAADDEPAQRQNDDPTSDAAAGTSSPTSSEAKR